MTTPLTCLEQHTKGQTLIQITDLSKNTQKVIEGPEVGRKQ